MVDAIGIPIVDYKLAVSNQAQLLAQFQKTPQFSQSVSYYQQNIGNVTSVDDLLGDRKLLTVALSAFQLESQVDDTGIWRQLLTQDPTQSGSLAQQLIDPRYLAFAQAFSSLNTDGGKAITSPASINAVLAGYQTNEFEKWVSANDGDPSVRQAMYFQRTIQDTIDISNVGSLYAQFQQSPAVSTAVNAYKSGVSSVTNVSQLLANQQVLDVALAAYKIDPTTISTDTVQQLLTEDPTDPNSLAQKDPQYLAFAQAFASLNTDGGLGIQSSSSVNTVISNYETNQFEQTLSTNDSSANSLVFGNTGASEITTIFNDFQQSSGVGEGIAYYQNNIGKVTTVEQFVADPQLLSVALSAYNLDSTTPAATIQQLLTQDPTDPNSLAQQDPQYLPFAQAFSSLNTDGGESLQSTANAVTSAYQTNQFAAYVGDKLQQANAASSSASGSDSSG